MITSTPSKMSTFSSIRSMHVLQRLWLCGVLCLVMPEVALAASSADSAAHLKPTKRSVSSSILVDQIHLDGISWTGWPDEMTQDLKAVHRTQVIPKFVQLMSNSEECYLYVASDARVKLRPSPKPGPDGPVISRYATPVFLGQSEVAVKPTWTDWNRLSGAVIAESDGHGTVMRSYIMVHVFSNRTAYLSFVGNDKDEFDLTSPPVHRVLTRPEIVEHWSELPRQRVGPFERDRHIMLLVGFSPKSFELGRESSSPAKPDDLSYYFGTGYMLNPYAAVTMGYTLTGRGKGRLAAGVTLDSGILGAIFQ